MTIKWIIPLDPRCEISPELIFVIQSWNPFEYSVTLRVKLNEDSHDITRIDNIGKDDHRDQFFLNSQPKKHLPIPISNIKNLNGLKTIAIYLEKNWQRFYKIFTEGE